MGRTLHLAEYAKLSIYFLESLLNYQYIFVKFAHEGGGTVVAFCVTEIIMTEKAQNSFQVHIFTLKPQNIQLKLHILHIFYCECSLLASAPRQIIENCYICSF